MSAFEDRMYELVVHASTLLAPDVKKVLAAGRAQEDPDSRSGLALDTIARNVDMAQDVCGAICQDTGMPAFFLDVPVGADQLEMEEAIRRALVRATDDGILRPNSMDSLSGKNEGNLGTRFPIFHFHQWRKNEIHARLVLKGGGSENKSIQYSLPAEIPGLGKAGRDLDGIRKCILHAVYQAQGQGCSPGFLGVGVGGDRMGSYELAKLQLFRHLEDHNPDPDLARLEDYVMEVANTFNIGTMGFAGDVTVLGCKIGARNRLPASFFVSVAYNCWAFRRQGVHLHPDTYEIQGWDYQVSDAPARLHADLPGTGAGALPPKRMSTPLNEDEIRALQVGDVVLLSGTIYTGRDQFHSYHMTHDCPVDMNGGVIYHCGPVMVNREGKWVTMAAGPTTSSREEPYQADIMKKLGLRAVIGKGGMGAKTLKGLADHGGVYFSAIGGAAQYCARCVKDVPEVHYLEFGVPEAMWRMDVEDFPLIVTMDSHGRSLHADVDADSLERLKKHAAKLF